MDYLPIFLNVRDQSVLVVGGGEVAARKVSLLLGAKARVEIVAPLLDPGLAALVVQGQIAHLARNFVPEDLANAVLVIAATDDLAVNQAVADAAKRRALPVNVVDQPALCSFIMPSIIERGRLTAAISTGGASPVLARLIRSRIELALPSGIERLVELAASWRDSVKGALPDALGRRRFWEAFLTGPWGRRVMAGETPDLATVLRETPVVNGGMTVIQVPVADIDALSIRSVKQIHAADLVLYEPDIPGEVLEHARRDSTRTMVPSIAANGAQAARAALDEGLSVVALAVG